MTPYESVCQFFTAYHRWYAMTNWKDWHWIAPRHLSSGLLAITEPDKLKEEAKKTKFVLGDELNDEYIQVLQSVKDLNAKLTKDFKNRRAEVERLHLEAVKLCFPINKRSGMYTAFDKACHDTIEFTLENNRWMDVNIWHHLPKKPGDAVTTHLDITPAGQRTTKRAYIRIDANSKITFDSTEHIDP